MGVLIPSDPGCCLRGGLLPCLPGGCHVGTAGRRVEGAPNASSPPQCSCAARRAAAAGAGGRGTSCRAPWASWHTGPSGPAPRRLAGKSCLVAPVSAGRTYSEEQTGMLPVKHPGLAGLIPATGLATGSSPVPLGGWPPGHGWFSLLPPLLVWETLLGALRRLLSERPSWWQTRRRGELMLTDESPRGIRALSWGAPSPDGIERAGAPPPLGS